MDTLFPLIVLIQTTLVVFAGVWFFRRNDEVPLIIAGLTMFFSSYRYFAVTQGWGEWIETVYTFGLPPITDEDALEVLPFIAFGEFVLMATYCARMRRKLPVVAAEGLQRLPPRTVSSLLALGIVFFFLSEYARSAAFNLTSSSYVFLFPLTLIGVATLLVAAWRFGALHTPFQKGVCLVIVAAAAYNNFGAFLRFQFVGLIIGMAVALSVFYAPRKRAVALLLGAIVAVLAFSLAGAIRQADNVNDKAAAFQHTGTSWDRLVAGGRRQHARWICHRPFCLSRTDGFHLGDGAPRSADPSDSTGTLARQAGGRICQQTWSARRIAGDAGDFPVHLRFILR
jgi:hypothetical protein